MLWVYVLQTTPGLFVIRGVKPVLVVPFALAIAMHEGEFVGGIYGAAAGLLCDVSGGSLFGYNGFFLALFCIASGLLVIYLLRCNLLGCILFVLVTMLVRGSLEFLFAYGMWGYPDVWKIYLFYTLPTAGYTVAVSPLLFWMVRALYRRFFAALHP